MGKSRRETRLIAILASASALLAAAPSDAEMIGKWNYVAEQGVCSISTKLAGATLVMLTRDGGSNVMAVAPEDQTSLVVDSKYNIQLTIGGTELPSVSTSAIDFAGAKVLYIPLKSASLANDKPYGVGFRVKMNGKEIFDMDQGGSREAFVAFVACSKKLGAKL